MGTRKLRSNERIARVSRITNTMYAAFSKSVSCTCKNNFREDETTHYRALTSRDLNSTLHPMLELRGGGLNLILCQLVDCMFCQRYQLEEKKVAKRDSSKEER